MVLKELSRPRVEGIFKFAVIVTAITWLTRLAAQGIDDFDRSFEEQDPSHRPFTPTQGELRHSRWDS